MQLTKMISSLLLLFIVVVFTAILFLYQRRHKNRYPALINIIYASGLQFISIVGFFLADKIPKGFFRVFTFGLSFLFMLFGFGVFLHSLLKLLDKKINKWFYYISGITITIISIITLLLYSTTKYFAMIVLTLVFVYYLLIILFVNFRRTKDQLLRWIPFSLLTLIPIVFVIVHIFEKVIFGTNNFEILYNDDGVNHILEIIIIGFTSTTIGLVTIINNFSFSYLDFESELFNQLFNSVPNVVIAIDPKTKLVKYVNKSFTKELGYLPVEVLNTFTLGQLLNYNMDDVNQILKGKTNGNCYTLYTKKKREYYANISSKIVNFEEGDLLVISITDISHIQSERNEYRKLAYYDELTTLPNRRVLQSNFFNKLSSEEKFALIIIDLDNFKAINDTYGHIMGDKVLIKVGELLRPYDGGTDTVSRFGGDEFVLLISPKPGMKQEDFINTLVGLFDKPFKIDGVSIKINLSWGYSCYPDDGHSITALIEKADTALYQNKRNKRI